MITAFINMPNKEPIELNWCSPDMAFFHQICRLLDIEGIDEGVVVDVRMSFNDLRAVMDWLTDNPWLIKEALYWKAGTYIYIVINKRELHLKTTPNDKN